MSNDTTTRRTKSPYKRDAQPGAVRDAKDAASRLAAHLATLGVTLSRAQSLEALSRAAGSTDWNTFRSGLSSTPDVVRKEIAEEVVSRVLHLHSGDVDSCVKAIACRMGHAGPGNDMWQRRAEVLIRAVYLIFHQAQQVKGIPDSVSAFREAFSLSGRNGFLHHFEICEQHFPISEATLFARSFLETLPGFSMEIWRKGKRQSTVTEDQFGYLSMQISKPLGDLIDVY